MRNTATAIIFSATFAAIIVALANIATAVEETVTTPAPGYGHGKLGDIAATVAFLCGLVAS